MSSISLKPLAELIQLSATAGNQIIAVLLTYNWKKEHREESGGVMGLFLYIIIIPYMWH